MKPHKAGALRVSCPTPQKLKFANEKRAREAGVEMFRRHNARRQIVEPLYWYACRCGSIHMTRNADGTSKPLYSVPEELQRWAFPPDEA